MEKIALIVTLAYRPESKAAFLDALFEHQKRCLATEPGTLQFEIGCPRDSDHSVVLLEVYANSQALTDHEAGASLAVFKEQAGPYITSASSKQCAVLQRD